MEYNEIKKAVNSIEMPENMKKRVIAKAVLSADDKKAMRRLRKRPITAIIAVALCLILSVPVLAVTVEPIGNFVTQLFRPVNEVCIDNGIKMEVISAYIHGNTIQAYISLQDTTGDRVDETTDLYDSYNIVAPFSNTGHCEKVGYDEKTGTATFLVTLEQWNNRAVEGKKITFFLREFLSHKSEYENVPVNFDLSSATIDAKTDKFEVSGGGGSDYESGIMGEGYDEYIMALVPEQNLTDIGIDNVYISSVGFVDGKLHIQSKIVDRLKNDIHGYFTLADKNGEKIEASAGYYLRGDGADTYIEDVFDVSPQEIEGYSIIADFTTSSLLTTGNWSVTFPIKREP